MACLAWTPTLKFFHGIEGRILGEEIDTSREEVALTKLQFLDRGSHIASLLHSSDVNDNGILE